MFEYKVVFAPSPRKSLLRFWQRKQSVEKLSAIFNEMAIDEWEYQSSERAHGTTKDMLVFRRAIPALDETNQKAVARAVMPETFDRAVVPRRPRPQALKLAEVPQFQARRNVESGRPVGTGAAIAMAPSK